MGIALSDGGVRQPAPGRRQHIRGDPAARWRHNRGRYPARPLNGPLGNEEGGSPGKHRRATEHPNHAAAGLRPTGALSGRALRFIFVDRSSALKGAGRWAVQPGVVAGTPLGIREDGKRLRQLVQCLLVCLTVPRALPQPTPDASMRRGDDLLVGPRVHLENPVPVLPYPRANTAS